MTIENTFRAMKEIVGGDIEEVKLPDPNMLLICNDNFHALGLQPNRFLWHQNDYIAGTFFIVGADKDHFFSLSNDQIKIATELFNPNTMLIPITSLIQKFSDSEMNAKSFLQNYLLQKRNLEEEALKAENEYDEACARRIRSDGTPDEYWINRMDIADSTRQSFYNQIQAITDHAHAIIHVVSNPVTRNVLRMHYIEGYTWAAIAQELHYGDRWIRRLGQRGLKEIETAFSTRNAKEANYHGLDDK